MNSQALVQIADAMRWLGFPPEVLIAGIVCTILGAFIPSIVDELRALSRKLQDTPSKYDDLAVPVLEGIAARLEGGVRDQATMDDLSRVIAKSVWESAKDPKHAKLVARELARDLTKRALRQIEEQASAAQQKV